MCIQVKMRTPLSHFSKVSRKTFNYIHSLVREHMTSQDTYFAFAVDSSINIATLFEANKEWRPLIIDVIWHFVEALEARGAQHISWASDIGDTKFWYESIGSVPNCYEAIEMTHINMYSCKNENEADVWRDNMNNKAFSKWAGGGLRVAFSKWAGCGLCLMWHPERYKLPRIISACCILRKLNTDMEGDVISNQFMTSSDHDPGYSPEKSTLPKDGNDAVGQAHSHWTRLIIETLEKKKCCPS
ncbi:hypothetical protein QVD17_17591 [Tagetes erecta]|uniref:Uncharacterized protein n=1 Tax=Tagetes erecta TaxID=13708 RepID=A0AAD8KX58_TARER|nr:hypothetical protein QVD17_17591 [Tagetes erecta]